MTEKNALQLANQQRHSPEHIKAIEAALMGGDLSQLTPEQKLTYYHDVCASLELNPLTKPFAFLKFQGKEVMYATKDCTDQLRSRRNVSVSIVDRAIMDDLLIVTARATLPSNRSDESIGALAVKGLVGDARANAMMKAETKAKRRVTLSICGLGIMDESEIETLPMAQQMSAEAPVAQLRTDGPDLVDALRKVEGAKTVEAIDALSEVLTKMNWKQAERKTLGTAFGAKRKALAEAEAAQSAKAATDNTEVICSACDRKGQHAPGCPEDASQGQV